MSVQAICAAFGTDDSFHGEEVQLSAVKEWSNSSDPEVLGLLLRYLITAKYAALVVPEISREMFVSFATKYLERCLIEDFQGFHSHTRYEAGWEIVTIFSRLWAEGSKSRGYCVRLKRWIETVLRSNDQEVRDCLVNATLEHLFENRSVAGFFSDWKESETLRQAYEDGMLWSQKGGTTA